MPTRQAGAHGSDAPKPSVDVAPNPRPVTVNAIGEVCNGSCRFVTVRAGATSSVTTGARCENETVPPDDAADVRDSNQTPSTEAPSALAPELPTPSRSPVAGGVSQTATTDDTAFIATANRPKTHRKLENRRRETTTDRARRVR